MPKESMRHEQLHLPLQAFVFDLDGTLVDSLEDIAAALNFVLTEEGYDALPLETYRAIVGRGALQLVEDALPPRAQSEAPRLEPAYRRAYAERMLDKTVPYPGIRETLDALVSRGVPCAVLSNKAHRETSALVAQMFPGVPFADVRGYRSGGPRKPDPSDALEIAQALHFPLEACALVGDTPIDIATARAAGMASIAVTWGFRSEAELRTANPDAVLHAPEELLALTRPA